jgi:hypothetical protein
MADIGTYDIFLDYSSNKMGFILGKDEQGNKRWWPGLAPVLAQQINTGAFSYEQIPSEIDVPVPIESWDSAGIADGGSTAAQNLRGYHYSQNIDASSGTRLYLSPERQAVLEDDATAIAAAPVKFADTTLGLFAIAGAYIYELSQGTGQWVERNDASGDAQNYTDIAEMDGILYACRGSAADYKYSSDGITWTAFTDSDNNFDRFAVRGITSAQAILWGVKSTGEIKNTTNGQNSGVAWSAADAVGHTSETVRGMVEANDDLYIFKNEGIYRYTGSATEDVWLGGKQMQRTSNGKYPFVWYDGSIYVPYGDQLLKFDPTQTDGVSLAFVFPTEHMAESDELNGTITAITGDAKWLYVTVKNSDGNSYIMRGNPYRNNGAGEWHTWVYLGANDCNALLVAGPGTIHTNNPALMAGYATAASYYILTRQGLRPEDDSNYRFDTTTSAKLVGSWKSVGAQSFPKFLNAGRIVAESTTAGRPLVLKYEVDSNLGVETTLVTATSVGSTTANQTADVSFNRIREIITMATADNTVTPVAVGFVFNTTPNPPRKRVWSFEVVVGDELEANGGVRSRYSGRDIEAFLFNSLNQRVTLYDRRNRSFVVRILDIRTVRAAPTAGGDTESVSMSVAQIGA